VGLAGTHEAGCIPSAHAASAIRIRIAIILGADAFLGQAAASTAREVFTSVGSLESITAL